MVLTWIGAVQIVIGLSLLLFGRLTSMFMFFLLSGLFGGSASLLLPDLGGSSVPPVQFALLFVYLRLLLPGGGQLGAISEAFRANLLLVLFTLYGVAAAIASPRIFAGAINVTPLRTAASLSLLEVVPLGPTVQNITTSVYLLTALLGAIAGYVMCCNDRGADTLVRGGIIFAWLHAVTGIFGAVAKDTALEPIFDSLRNGNYDQLSQTAEGFVRIAGVFPEASAYAAAGFGWFVFNCECWYRSILSRSTGIAAALLGLVLFFSTSSTAYVALGCYLILFCLRILLLPRDFDAVRLGQAGFVALLALAGLLLALIFVPQVPAAIAEIIRAMTVGKLSSDSGAERTFLALQGWNAFLASGGVGIGPGSFRSSSLITAILGSMGVVGMVSFLAYLVSVVQPGRASTWGRAADAPTAVGGAAACAALMSVVPAAIASQSSAPAIGFAIFAGAALALRARSASRLGESGPALRQRRERAPSQVGAPG